MKQERIKQLIERYPFLLPRNAFTDKIPEDYDYSCILPLEIPRGWQKLFLQMCEDIRQPLIDENLINDFQFVQVKEKYNTMRCYHNGAPEKICDIINKYEMMAGYVCTKCGRPAEYETTGYIASFCNNCWKDFARHEAGEFIEFHPYYKVSGFKNGKHFTKEISFEDEWNRYLENLQKPNQF